VPTVVGNNANSNMVCVGYGNDPNGSDQDQRTSVWASHYQGVYHLNENSPNGVLADSTGNARDLTAVGIPTTSNIIQVHKGITTNGSNSGYTAPSTVLGGTGDLVMTVWQSSNASGKDILTDSGWQNAEMYTSTNNGVGMWYVYGATTYRRATTTPLINNVVRHLGYRYKSGGSPALEAYVNGVVENGTAWGTLPAARTATSNLVRIGCEIGYYLAEQVDELRFSNDASIRTADWLKLEYHSMK
jgi:hypothetical protein